MIFLCGFLLVWSGIIALMVNFEVMSVLSILVGIYANIAGVLAYVTRSDRMRT